MKGRVLLVCIVCSVELTVVANFLTTTLSLWTAGPGQVTPLAVFAFDSLIHFSTSATLAGDSLAWMLSHPELQVCRQWKRPHTLTLPTLGMRSVNRPTLSHSAYDVKAKVGWGSVLCATFLLTGPPSPGSAFDLFAARGGASGDSSGKTALPGR
jgi:hypothetical protein